MSLQNESPTRTLARFISNTPSSKIPTSAMEKAKECVLDAIGCGLGGAQDEMNRNIFRRLNELSGGCDIPGAGRIAPLAWGQNARMPLLVSVLFNGIQTHTLELDDVHRSSKIHAGTVIIPATLGVGENLGATGLEVLRAVVIGYEVAHRLGAAINVSEHRARGWHSTATLGVFGAAASTGVLLGLTEDEMTSALGLAGTQSSGLWAFLADGAANKRFHAGMASQHGVLSAELAQAGLTGPSHILEASDGGLFPATSHHYDFDAVTRGWGEEYLIEGISIKPYACCRSMHAAIDAVLSLKAEHGLKTDQVRGIEIETYGVAKKQCGSEEWPTSPNAAQFSMRYGVAVALTDGQALAKQFSMKRLEDKELQLKAPPVEIRATKEFDEKYPGEWGCRIHLSLETGTTLMKTVNFPKGDPENPLSHRELREKFYSLAEGSAPQNRIRTLADMIENLDHVANVRDLPL